jgi:hypothetical protein
MFSFSLEEFLSVLGSYNLAIWPLQIFAYIAVIVALFFSFRPGRTPARIVLAILTLFWLFSGIVFSLIYWSPSHFFGFVFGICFILQGLIFIYGIVRSDITMSLRNTTYTVIGILFVVYAAVGYQVFGYYLGHIYPKFFVVGLVPCPTTILTFGLFLIMNGKIPMKYLIIPIVISLGGILAVYEGIYEDIGLIVTGILGTVLIILRNAEVPTGE